MKKIILLLSAFALILNACSSDDSPSQTPINQNGVLVKKMIYTSQDEPQDSPYNTTVNFTYNGNKLVQGIDDDNYKSVFTYTGDLITKIESFDNNTLDSQDLFTYNSSGKLTEYRYLSFFDGYEHKYTYTYNLNGTVTVAEFQGTIGNTTGDSSYVYTYTNGELSSTDTNNYTYDSKNNPFKNVVGFQNIMSPEFTDDFMIAFGRNHNIVATTIGSSTTEGIFSTYTYNSDNYPVTSTTNANNPNGGFIGTVNVQYFY